MDDIKGAPRTGAGAHMKKETAAAWIGLLALAVGIVAAALGRLFG